MQRMRATLAPALTLLALVGVWLATPLEPLEPTAPKPRHPCAHADGIWKLQYSVSLSGQVQDLKIEALREPNEAVEACLTDDILTREHEAGPRSVTVFRMFQGS